MWAVLKAAEWAVSLAARWAAWKVARWAETTADTKAEEWVL